jgi:putative heme iron utilization protein
MDGETSALLGALIRGRSVAAIATLHDGKPYSSMIPYAVDVDPGSGPLRFVSHVSRLSAHTRDMLAAPEVCLLITAPEQPGLPPQALPRVSVPCLAEFLDPSHPDHQTLRSVYLSRFPHAADYFLLGDFSLVSLAATSARFIAGFARAMTLSPSQVAAAVRGSDDDVSGLGERGSA